MLNHLSLFRSGGALPVVAFATAASAASARAAVRPAFCSLWLSTMASLMSTPTSAGGHHGNMQLK